MNINISLYLSKNYTNRHHANIPTITELPGNRQAARQAAAQQTDYRSRTDSPRHRRKRPRMAQPSGYTHVPHT